jgi:hypothetical protein
MVVGNSKQREALILKRKKKKTIHGMSHSNLFINKLIDQKRKNHTASETLLRPVGEIIVRKC